MPDMVICGLSMEMELAEEMGTIGKCCSCLHFDKPDGLLYCRLKEVILNEEVEDCPDWSVDYR